MKRYRPLLIAAAMAFSVVPIASFADGVHKSYRDYCISTLQPPVAKGQTLTAAQEEEVSKCVAAKEAKKERMRQEGDATKPTPDTPPTPPKTPEPPQP
jgi:hypothetical protein